MLKRIKLTGYFILLLITGVIIGAAYALQKLESVGNNRYSPVQSFSPTQTLSDSVSGSDPGNTSVHSPSPHLTNRGSLRVNKTVQSTANFPIDLIQHLHVQFDQLQGNMDIDYHSDPNGNVQVNGHIGSTQIHLTGGEAKQEILKVITNSGLSDILPKILADPTVKILMPALQHLEIQTTDGTHINLQQSGGQFHVDVQK